MTRSFLILALCCAATAVQAEQAARSPLLSRHNSNAPIDIASDKTEADLNSKTVTYIGNVIITQADLKMRADTVKAEMAENRASRITASGKVVVDSPSSGTATGDNGVYDVPKHLITLTGRHVVLAHNKDVSSGTKLTVNLTTGIASFVSDKAQGGTGRVTAVLNPAQAANPPDGK